MTKKIVINTCHGGFGLSKEAIDLYKKLKKTKKDVQDYKISREDKYLIEVIETLGREKANDLYSQLKIVEIPSDVEYTIEEHDGIEWVAEAHRTWY
jgi:hypothetical protein